MNYKDISRYNIVWDSPSKDYFGTMPLGNGGIGVNAWVDPEGIIRFYISSTDSWADNGELLKIGAVSIKLSPQVPMEFFRQELKLVDGIMNVTFGKGKNAVNVKLI